MKKQIRAGRLEAMLGEEGLLLFEPGLAGKLRSRGLAAAG